MKKLLIILFIGVCLVSCSTQKKVVQVAQQKPKPKIEKPKVVVKKPLYNTYSCKFSGSYNNIPIRGSLRSCYDSVVWISINVLGIEQARCLITKDTVYMLNKIEKEAYVCTYNRITQFAGLPLSLSFVQDLFTDTIAKKTFNTPKFSASITKQSHNVTEQLKLPYEINFKGVVNSANQSLNLKLKDQEINNPLSFPFDIPSNYKVRH